MICDSYGAIYRVYDRLNADIDYAAWADFIEVLFREHAGIPVSSVLDLACGTGSMTLELARRGYDMIGVDRSPEMLSVARERASEDGYEPLLLEQDMREFELYGTVDAVVSTLDSINYLSGTAELVRVFSLVNNYLNPGGVFIFDVNTPYKFREIFADNAFVLEDDGIYCGWQNRFEPRRGICDFFLTVFERMPDGTYRRNDEEQREHCFSERTLRRALDASGLELCGLFGDYALSSPAPDCERWYFAARTRK